MRLLKWYGLALAGSALLLTALTSVLASEHYRQLDSSAFPPSWILERVAFDMSDLVSAWAFPLLGLTFAVGLVALLRIREPSVLALSPALLVLTVGTLTTLAAVISWYGVVSSTDVAPTFAASAITREVALLLGVALCLSAVLSAVAAFRTRRAT